MTLVTTNTAQSLVLYLWNSDWVRALRLQSHSSQAHSLITSQEKYSLKKFTAEKCNFICTLIALKVHYGFIPLTFQRTVRSARSLMCTSNCSHSHIHAFSELSTIFHCWKMILFQTCCTTKHWFLFLTLTGSLWRYPADPNLTKTQRFKVLGNYKLMNTYLWTFFYISANKLLKNLHGGPLIFHMD